MRISDWSSDVCSSDLLVDQAEGLGFLRGHETVAFHCRFDRGDILAGMPGVDYVQPGAQVEDLPGVDLDVGGLALEAAGRLMDQHSGVRQGVAHALLADRNSVVSGQRGAGRYDPGGRRSIKKKKKE